MRLLLLSLYYAPDVGANAVIMTALAQELAKLGNQVTVVTSFPHYTGHAIPKQYRGRLFQRERDKGIEIYRTNLYTSPHRHKLAARAFNYATFNALSTCLCLIAGSQDIILAPSPPLTIGLSAYMASRLKRIPFIYNVQDIYPDIAIRLGVLTNPTAIRIFRWIEAFVYSKAAAVTVLSEGFRRNLIAKHVPVGKLHIIPNFVDTDFVRPLSKDNPFARQNGLVDRFVVLYSGNVGLSQGLETLLATAPLLSDLPDLCIAIVGDGAAKSKLLEQARGMGLSNVRFFPFQPQASVPDVYATADVSLVLLKRGIGAESVPSKAYTILASGRPLVAAVDDEAETRQLIADARNGLAVPPENPHALADAIRILYADPALREQFGVNGRRYVVSYHTPLVVARQYNELLRDLAGSSP